MKCVIKEEFGPFHGVDTPSLDHLPKLGPYPYLPSLCDHIAAYNASLGCAALDSVDRLRHGVPCVVTGQQLGFMGGPAYTILKGISTLLIARDLGAVPIFWLATEDHDLAEINHTYALSPRGDLQRYRLKLPQQPLFVEDLTLRQEDLEEIQRFTSSLSIDLPMPQVGERYATAMARILAYLFRGTPMIFVEPYLFRHFSQNFFAEELLNAEKLEDLLIHETQKLPAAPISPQGGTHLFFKGEKGYRQKILLTKEGFQIGDQPYNDGQMQALLAQFPQKFSCGVASRPLLQSYHLPVVAYVAGPTEYRYWPQLKPLFEHHRLPMPLVIPRISATLIPSEATNILQKCRLNPWDPLPQNWKEWEGAKGFWQDAFTEGGNSDIVAGDRTQLRHQEKQWKRMLEEKGIPHYGIHFLQQLLHPHGHWQERVLNWCYFESEESSLVQRLLSFIDWRERGHHYVYLGKG